MRKRIVLLFIFIILNLQPYLYAEEADNREAGVLISSVGYLADEHDRYCIDDIVENSIHFVEVTEKNKNQKFTYGSIWVKLTAKNNTRKKKDLLLQYNQVWTGYVDFYHHENTGLAHIRTGTAFNYQNRPYNHETFIFPVSLTPGYNNYYFRLKSRDRIVLDFRLWEREKFAEKFERSMPVLWIFYSIILAMLLYNIFLFFFIKEKIYFLYVMLFFSFLIFLSCFDGTGFRFFWPWAPALNDILTSVMLFFLVFCVLLFFREFSGIKKISPVLTRYLDILSVLTLVVIAVKLIHPPLIVFSWGLPLLQLIAFSLLAVTSYLSVKKARPAIIFLIAFGILIIFGLLNSFISMGLLGESKFIHYGMHLGAIAVAIVFSLAMADNVNRVRLENENAALTIRDQYSKLKITNQELEATNEELQAAMEEQESTNDELQRSMEELENANMRIFTNEQRLNAIFNHAAIAIAVIDRDGNPLQINDYCVQLSGYTREEIFELNYMDVIPPEDISVSRELIGKLFNGELNSYRTDRCYKRKNQELIWVDLSMTLLLDEKGEPAGIIGVALDITEKINSEKEKEKIQAQLRQSQKMEAVGTLAGGIAHDFNNILTAVIGFTELSLHDIPGNHQITDNLQQVLQSAYRARDLVKQLLTLSRQKDQEKRIVRIEPVLTESVKLMRATIPVTIEIDVKTEFDNDAVIADPTNIHQVIINLCTNAAHSMAQKGGVLKIVLKNTIIDDEFNGLHGNLKIGKYIVIQVTDTGHGIPSAIRDRIFDPFFTTKEKGMGTGLGLSVVQGIVRNLGGDILVNSEENKGSEFEIFIPVIKFDEDESEKQTEEIAGGDESILLVDDERAIAVMNSRILERLGYDVEYTTDSRYALEMIKKEPHRFDLIVTDQTMPRITGDELAVEVLKINPGLPIILCTGFSEIIDQEGAEEIGITTFLYKPVVMEDLAKAVRSSLDKKKK